MRSAGSGDRQRLRTGGDFTRASLGIAAEWQVGAAQIARTQVGAFPVELRREPVTQKVRVKITHTGTPADTVKHVPQRLR